MQHPLSLMLTKAQLPDCSVSSCEWVSPFPWHTFSIFWSASAGWTKQQRKIDVLAGTTQPKLNSWLYARQAGICWNCLHWKTSESYIIFSCYVETVGITVTLDKTWSISSVCVVQIQRSFTVHTGLPCVGKVTGLIEPSSSKCPWIWVTITLMVTHAPGLMPLNATKTVYVTSKYCSVLIYCSDFCHNVHSVFVKWPISDCSLTQVILLSWSNNTKDLTLEMLVH